MTSVRHKTQLLAVAALTVLAVLLAGPVVPRDAALAATVPVISTDRSQYLPPHVTTDTMYISVVDGDARGSGPTTTGATLTVTVTASGTAASVTKVLSNCNSTSAATDCDTNGTRFGSLTNLTDDPSGLRAARGVLFCAGLGCGGGSGALTVSTTLQVTAGTEVVTISYTNPSGNTASITRNVKTSTGTFTGSTSTIAATSTAIVSSSADTPNMTIVYNDPDDNTSSTSQQTVTVTVKSQILGGSGVSQVLNETASNTGVFTGKGFVTSGSGTERSGDTSLSTPTTFALKASSSGDTITISRASDRVDAGTTATTSTTATFTLGSAGTIALDKSEYSNGDTMLVTVTDTDVGTPSAIDTTVTNTSTDISSSGTPTDGSVRIITAGSGASDSLENVTLTETGLATNVFTLRVGFDFDEGTTDNSTVDAGLNFTYTAQYRDAQSGSTTAATRTATATFLTESGTLTVTPSAVRNGSVLTITVVDKDLNLSGSVTDTTTAVTLRTADNVNDTLIPTLRETGINTNEFTALVTVAVLVASTDSKTATLIDVLDGKDITVEFGDVCATTSCNLTSSTTTASALAVATRTRTVSAASNQGVVSLNNTQYTVTSTAEVTLVDLDLDTTTSANSFLTNGLYAFSTSDVENTTQSGSTITDAGTDCTTTPAGCDPNIRVVETGGTTGIFTGALRFRTGSTIVSTDGTSAASAILHVSPGDTITVKYRDLSPSAAVASTASATIPTNTGTISIDQTIIPGVSGTEGDDSVLVTVTDADLNVTTGSDTVNVGVKSTTDNATGITVNLTETGGTTGIFTGIFKTIVNTDGSTTVVGTTSDDTNDRLIVQNGDGVTATYSDTKNASGTLATASANATARFTDATIALSVLGGSTTTAASAGAKKQATTTSFSIGDTVVITVTDLDENTKSDVAQSRTVSVRTTTDVVGTTATVRETGLSTGIFTGPMALSSTTTIANTSIKAGVGDTLTVSYTDRTPFSDTTFPYTALRVEGTASVAAVGQVVVSPTTVSVQVGATQTITVVRGGPAIFTSANAATASVTSAGVITGVAVGTTTVTARNTTTNQSTAIPVTVIAAVVTGAARSGDLDGDGSVGSDDALDVLRAIARGETLTAEQIAAIDLDGNGRAGAIDAACMLRLNAGLALPSFCSTGATTTAASEATKDQAAAPTIVAGNGQGTAGATGVAVAITSASALEQLLAIDGSLTYDANVLNATSVTVATGLQGTPELSAGTVRFALSSAEGINVASGGTILTITFTVAAAASTGDSALDLAIGDFATFSGVATPTVTDGTFTVIPPPTTVVVANYQTTSNWVAFALIDSAVGDATQTLTMTAYPDGASAVTCSTASLAGGETVASLVSDLCEGTAGSDGWVKIVSSPSSGGVAATIASFPPDARVLISSGAAATGNRLTLPYVVGLNDRYIIVNPNDAAEEVTPSLWITSPGTGGGAASVRRVTGTAISIPANSRISRSFAALFPAENISGAALVSNVSVSSTNPIAGANCIGSADFGFSDCAAAQARTQ
ncbi:MAG: hypothetical protein HYY96_06125 [Candidatus Tectomicrobia bacterium]|nr:hypothetical protein [Candidatus Tectomicrobia bacterium]